MSVRITLHCDGCDAVTRGGTIAQEFESLSGRGYGFGTYHIDIKWDIPEGWIVHDPYTSATYCPGCWGDILAHTEGSEEMP